MKTNLSLYDIEAYTLLYFIIILIFFLYFYAMIYRYTLEQRTKKEKALEKPM